MLRLTCMTLIMIFLTASAVGADADPSSDRTPQPFALGAGDDLGQAIFEHYGQLARRDRPTGPVPQDARLVDELSKTDDPPTGPHRFVYVLRIGPWQICVIGQGDTIRAVADHLDSGTGTDDRGRLAA